MSGSQLLLLGGVPAAAIPVDPYFYSVTSLLHGDGTNGGQNNTFLDSSSNNFTITRNGNTTQGSFSPFSQTGWGNYFDGATDSLTATNNAAYDFGSGAFTIEGWAYPTTASQLAFAARGQTTGFEGWILSTTNFLATTNGSTWDITITFTNALTANAWNHVAIVRNGNVYTAYLNGVANGTTTVSGTIVSGTAALVIGRRQGQTDYSGYISNFRIVKGTAVYTAAFTPPTTPLTAITNTSLLTCQSNRFIDNSTNAFAITVSGDTSVQPFSPFNPTTAYSASSIGGSGYFDGSGDYLNGPSTGQFAPTGNFTISMWIYPTSFAAAYYVLAGSWNTGTSDEWLIQYDNTGAIRFLTTTDSTFSAAGVIKLNQWQFISISRSGSTLTGYVNGTSFRSYTLSGTVGSATKVVYIGAQQGTTWPYAGYMADFRLVAGSAESATPPTAPATAISGTNMLLNFTNGAIFDNAAVADYETVGNAQISTSVKKYGTGSLAFDGTGDRLFVGASSPNLSLRGSDYTVEMWVYPNSYSGFPYLISSGAGGTAWAMYLDTGGALGWGGNTGANQFTAGNVPLSTWTHVAVSQSANVAKWYINGNLVLTKTATDINNANWVATNQISIGSNFGANDFNGYIDDLRISKGIGRYPYNFTPPTAEFPNIGGTVTLTADPYYEYTTLLLPGNGTNGAQNNTFLDSSTNAFTITRNGNTTQGTFSPFSQTGWGNYFDGTANGFLSTPATTDLDLSADFTVQAWVYPTANGQASNSEIICRGAASTLNGWHLVFPSGTTQPCFQVNFSGLGNSSTSIQSSVNVPLNYWTHIAITRSGNTAKIYINGNLDTTNTGFTTAPTTNGSDVVYIGRSSYDTTNRQFTGYVSNASVIKGTALTTFNTTTPLSTSTSGQSLLTCTANRFFDANTATTAKAITAGSGASVQAFSPFNPTASWSAATYGGSGYFDGSGDYLTAADNAAFTLGSGDWCSEGWVYPTYFPAFARLWGQDQAGASTNGSVALFMANGAGTSSPATLNLRTVVAGSMADYNYTVTLVPNQWNHIAAYRISGTIYLAVNGSVQTARTTAGSVNDSSLVYAIGANQGGTENWQGYISGHRLVVGSAVYTSSNFTPPTAPLTAITNTSLLLNYTNAGIYDATSKNDLETVGNAQISTTQSKFGGSSMYFDGAGDYLVGPWNSLTDLGAGDFTIEFWMYPTAVGQSSVTYLFYIGTSGNYAPILIGQAVSGYGIVLYSSSTGSSWNLASGSSFGTATANAWNHVALTRYGADVRLFLNGAVGTTLNWGTTALLTGSSHKPNIGSATGVANTYYTGYMQDLRVTKGIARYTSNFTPPTTAFLTL